jgi:hypothetical protein
VQQLGSHRVGGVGPAESALVFQDDRLAGAGRSTSKAPLLRRDSEHAFNDPDSIIDVGGFHPKQAAAGLLAAPVVPGLSEGLPPVPRGALCRGGRTLTPEKRPCVRPVAPQTAAPGEQLEEHEQEGGCNGDGDRVHPGGEADSDAGEDIERIARVFALLRKRTAATMPARLNARARLLCTTIRIAVTTDGRTRTVLTSDSSYASSVRVCT